MKNRLVCLVALCCMGGSLFAQQLRFGSDGKFKIVQFTDVHWVAGNPASEEASVRMNEVLEAEKTRFCHLYGRLDLWTSRNRRA